MLDAASTSNYVEVGFLYPCLSLSIISRVGKNTLSCFQIPIHLDD